MADLPATAAWRLVDAHDGFEVVFLRRGTDGFHLHGHSTGIEEGQAWGISYALTLDPGWATRSAHVIGRSASGEHEAWLEGDGRGEWLLDSDPLPHIAGCLDVDLEGSAFTNALPVHRLALDVGQRAEAPAAYVRALDLSVERLDQTYERLEDGGGQSRYDYSSPRFEYRNELVYDEFGLVLEYPGIALRVT